MTFLSHQHTYVVERVMEKFIKTQHKYCKYPLCCGSGSAWIHIDLGIWLSRIRNRILIVKADPDTDTGARKFRDLNVASVHDSAPNTCSDCTCQQNRHLMLDLYRNRAVVFLYLKCKSSFLIPVFWIRIRIQVGHRIRIVLRRV
jgi:hypothetical protein